MHFANKMQKQNCVPLQIRVVDIGPEDLTPPAGEAGLSVKMLKRRIQKSMVEEVKKTMSLGDMANALRAIASHQFSSSVHQPRKSSTSSRGKQIQRQSSRDSRDAPPAAAPKRSAFLPPG
jgi:hypothetical protein